MATETRDAGWYPDPWGTEHERHFDGSAWSRQTRAPGSSDAAEVYEAYVVPDSPTVSGPPSGPSAAAPTASPGGEPSVPVPAGWHQDPWGLASLRWWDGAIWTGHVSGPPAARPIDVQGERSLARWLRPALLVAGLAQAAGLFVAADQSKWLVENWNDLVRGVDVAGRPSAGAVGQLTFLIGVSVGVLFLLWFYRAASTGWASRLPARRSPILATLSFLIPILNLWWPYLAARDMVPAGDARRSLIGRWWVLWLLGALSTPLVYGAAAVFDQTAAWVVAAVGACVTMGAALAARELVEYVTTTHERLAQSGANAT